MGKSNKNWITWQINSFTFTTVHIEIATLFTLYPQSGITDAFVFLWWETIPSLFDARCFLLLRVLEKSLFCKLVFPEHISATMLHVLYVPPVTWMTSFAWSCISVCTCPRLLYKFRYSLGQENRILSTEQQRHEKAYYKMRKHYAQ